MSRSPTMTSWLPSSVNRLALKIAGPVTIAALGTILLPAWGIGEALGLSLFLGLLTYGAAHYWLHQRLARLRSAARHLRQHAFDELTPPGPSDDELSLLGWELYRTGHTVEHEIQALKERESYRREFIGNVSHELKTPIFSAQGFAETLLDGAIDDEEVNRTFLKKILRNVTRLENLARDLSAITKIETDEMEMSNEAFHLDDLFGDVRDSLELKANENNVTLQSEDAGEVPPVYGDPERIRRVLVNLVDNAIKYNEAGGTVTIQAHPRSADEVEVSVIDDGIGIPSEHQSRLTERFYRVDKSRSRNQGGTGLGLAIVKHILAAHDRSLHVDSTPGEGSRFSFTLPTRPVSRL